mmetsp:Transcript_22484/g.47568  ORF Transcript_22484/g.47568 Transcript_22484/m.47568 type:complete len:446 (-) Transcript_22484:650-1987(-)
MTVTSTKTTMLPALLAACIPLTGVVAWTQPVPPSTANFRSEQMVFEQHQYDHRQQTITIRSSSSSTTTTAEHIYDWATRQGQTVGEFLVPPAFAAEASGPPTKNEILTLQKAFAAFYGTQRDPQAALPLLDESIQAFQRQPADERAGLYRVRGDCKMALKNPTAAIEDYTTAIELLNLPEAKDKADPVELPASILGRARAIRSLGSKATPQQAETAAKDYKEALVLSSREDWDTVEEKLEDGAKTNPYAAWEYGMALRRNEQYEEAKTVHLLASDLFDAISDRSRSVISLLDAGIDAACVEASSSKDSGAKDLLKKAVAYTTTAESRDVSLLQRVVAKEGEGRIVLAAIEWTDTKDKSLRGDAEKELSTACERLDQLEQDALARGKKAPPPSTSTAQPLRFNIDDYPGALETSCSRLTKNKDFQSDRLELPTVMQDKIQKLNQLK